jgi:hypothetical protein
MQSPIYWHPFFYRTAMKLSYGSQYTKRCEALVRYIPDGAALFEACMGDAFFYHRYLKAKNIRYACGDINPVFVNAALVKGLDARLLNVFSDEIPKTDYILMQASLSYFIPQEASVIMKLLNAANKRLIIAESVHNLSNSSSGFKSAVGTFLSKAKAGQSKIKFTRESLQQTLAPFKDHIETIDERAGQRETIIVLKP